MTIWTKLKRWYTNADKQEQEQQRDVDLCILASSIDSTNAQVDCMRSQISALSLQVASLVSEAAEEPEDPNAAHKASSEPWVEVVGEKWDEVKGMEIKLDWNEAFIVRLRELGIAGKDDSTVVHKWLAMLYEDMSERISDDVTDRDGEANQYV